MGSLHKFNVEGLRVLHSCRTFVETGTAQGDSLEYVRSTTKFEQLHSIEIEKKLADAARDRFAADPRVRIWQGNSVEVLPELIRLLSPEPVLWWLDAHYPGAHSGAAYDAEPDIAVRLPLRRELELIRELRPGRAARDAFVVDDARIWLDGPFGSGQLSPDHPALLGVERGIDFVRDGFRETHGVVVDYANEGYIMIFPRALSVARKKAA